jgi:hypothetical protein
MRMGAVEVVILEDFRYVETETAVESVLVTE